MGGGGGGGWRGGEGGGGGERAFPINWRIRTHPCLFVNLFVLAVVLVIAASL